MTKNISQFIKCTNISGAFYGSDHHLVEANKIIPGETNNRENIGNEELGNYKWSSLENPSVFSFWG